MKGVEGSNFGLDLKYLGLEGLVLVWVQKCSLGLDLGFGWSNLGLDLCLKWSRLGMDLGLEGSSLVWIWVLKGLVLV